MATNKKPIRPQALGRHLNFSASASTAMCNRMLEQHGLTLPQWVVLAALWQKDNLTVGEIADYCGNNIPATSRILDRMVQKALVVRDIDKDDRRTVRISLASAGEAVRHLNRFHEQVNRQLLNGISPGDAKVLYALLERVEANARNWQPTP